LWSQGRVDAVVGYYSSTASSLSTNGLSFATHPSGRCDFLICHGFSEILRTGSRWPCLSRIVRISISSSRMLSSSNSINSNSSDNDCNGGREIECNAYTVACSCDVAFPYALYVVRTRSCSSSSCFPATIIPVPLFSLAEHTFNDPASVSACPSQCWL